MRKFAACFSQLVCLLFYFTPELIKTSASWMLAYIWVDVLRLRRKMMLKNIENCFPDSSPRQRIRWMRKSVFVLVKSLFDLFKIPFVNQKWINKNIVMDGFDQLKNSEGVFFLCLHMASGDLAAAVISDFIKPVSLISKRFTNQFVDEFWFSTRQKSKTQFIDAHAKNNAFEILKALREKKGIAFVLDQFMGMPYGVESLFFNRKTGTAYGLALFVLKTKKPVYPMYSYFDDYGKLHLSLKPAIDLSDLIDDNKSDLKNEALKIALTNRFNAELEKIITEHPDQWMWVHNRWKVFE